MPSRAISRKRRQRTTGEYKDRKRSFTSTNRATQKALGMRSPEHIVIAQHRQQLLGRGVLQGQQFGWLGPFEDAAGIGADLTKTVQDVSSVAHQPAG